MRNSISNCSAYFFSRHFSLFRCKNNFANDIVPFIYNNIQDPVRLARNYSKITFRTPELIASDVIINDVSVFGLGKNKSWQCKRKFLRSCVRGVPGLWTHAADYAGFREFRMRKKKNEEHSARVKEIRANRERDFQKITRVSRSLGRKISRVFNFSSLSREIIMIICAGYALSIYIHILYNLFQLIGFFAQIVIKI